MKLTILGNNSTTASAGGACSSYLVEASGKKILMDMGSGSIFNLKKITGVDDIDAIIITHHHFDHFVDIMLMRYEKEGRIYMGEEVKPIPLYTPKMPDWLFESLNKNHLFDFHFIEKDETVNIGELSIDFVPVLHLLETYAVRIKDGEKVLTYSADTGLCQGILTASEDADLFLCEASYGSYDPYVISHHLTGKEAGEIAKMSTVRKLLLTHLPEHGKENVLKDAQEVFRNTELSEIMKSYEI
ncbi:MBL fold metallo-hydrolase [Proteiniclasticum sp.]|uniref:MBL fold metallo-hydrolase n=1 Tax=Proteiniclasticum sp. TaxID=2053595 RepID=UPI00289E3E17|nr:MBL fold metallo-hydrolase [Proteiniclasticum sp.]